MNRRKGDFPPILHAAAITLATIIVGMVVIAVFWG